MTHKKSIDIQDGDYLLSRGARQKSSRSNLKISRDASKARARNLGLQAPSPSSERKRQSRLAAKTAKKSLGKMAKALTDDLRTSCKKEIIAPIGISIVKFRFEAGPHYSLTFILPARKLAYLHEMIPKHEMKSEIQGEDFLPAILSTPIALEPLSPKSSAPDNKPRDVLPCPESDDSNGENKLVGDDRHHDLDNRLYIFIPSISKAKNFPSSEDIAEDSVDHGAMLANRKATGRKAIQIDQNILHKNESQGKKFKYPCLQNVFPGDDRLIQHKYTDGKVDTESTLATDSFTSNIRKGHKLEIALNSSKKSIETSLNASNIRSYVSTALVPSKRFISQGADDPVNPMKRRVMSHFTPSLPPSEHGSRGRKYPKFSELLLSNPKGSENEWQKMHICFEQGQEQDSLNPQANRLPCVMNDNMIFLAHTNSSANFQKTHSEDTETPDGHIAQNGQTSIPLASSSLNLTVPSNPSQQVSGYVDFNSNSIQELPNSFTFEISTSSPTITSRHYQVADNPNTKAIACYRNQYKMKREILSNARNFLDRKESAALQDDCSVLGHGPATDSSIEPNSQITESRNPKDNVNRSILGISMTHQNIKEEPIREPFASLRYCDIDKSYPVEKWERTLQPELAETWLTERHLKHNKPFEKLAKEQITLKNPHSLTTTTGHDKSGNPKPFSKEKDNHENDSVSPKNETTQEELCDDRLRFNTEMKPGKEDGWTAAYCRVLRQAKRTIQNFSTFTFPLKKRNNHEEPCT